MSTLLPIVRVHLCVLASIALLGYTTLTTSPRDKLTRAALFPLILAPTLYTAVHARDAGPVQLWNVYLGMMFGSHYAFSALHILFLSGETYTPPPPSQRTWKSNLTFTLDIALNKRRINRPDRTANIPPHPLPPSKPRFLLTRTLRFLALYLTLDLLTIHPLPNPTITCAPGQERILHRLFYTTTLPLPSLLELVGIVLGYGLGGVIGLSACYDLAAIVLVAVGISEPADWPPLFADPREAYSVRRFWGVFWHQSLRIVLVSAAEAVVHSVLRVPRADTKAGRGRFTRQLARYTKLLVALLLSGAMHLVSDRAHGVNVQESGSIKFFFLQGVGMAVEDCVQGAYRYLWGTKRGEKKENEKPAVWIRALGLVWVGAFMVVTAPTWGFPVLRKGETDVVPVKVVERFI